MGERMKVHEIAFICEQDGPPERELKCGYLNKITSIKKAYLVRVAYDGLSELHVALCIVAQDISGEDVVPMIGAIFREVFGASQHMDILFIDKKQERKALKVSQPFFERT